MADGLLDIDDDLAPDVTVRDPVESAGTVLGALARGVPVVVIPLGADHGGHARAVTDHGAGIALPRDSLRAEDVTDAVQRLLDDPSYRIAAEQLGRQLAALPGPELAVSALETLSSTAGAARRRAN